VSKLRVRLDVPRDAKGSRRVDRGQLKLRQQRNIGRRVETAAGDRKEVRIDDRRCAVIGRRRVASPETAIQGNEVRGERVPRGRIIIREREDPFVGKTALATEQSLVL